MLPRYRIPGNAHDFIVRFINAVISKPVPNLLFFPAEQRIARAWLPSLDDGYRSRSRRPARTCILKPVDIILKPLIEDVLMFSPPRYTC